MRHSFTSSRVLLTGASSGIGEALAIELAKEGADLVLLARREGRLKNVVEQIHSLQNFRKEQIIETVVGDMTDASVRQRAIDVAAERLGGIDYLINNAGVGATSLMELTSEETLRRLFEVNFFALVDLTKRSLPFLKDSAKQTDRLKLGIRPMIVNLSSIVGLRGVPHYGAYGAAKFAVAGLSESWRAELAREGIELLLVCPGTTKTEFFDVLLQSGTSPTMPVHQEVTAEYVATRIVKAMKKGKHKIIPYFQAKILDLLNRFVPGFVDSIMVKYV